MSEFLTALSALPGYAGMSMPLRQALLEEGRLEHLRPGKWLFGEGNEPNQPALILAGLMGIYRSVASQTVLVGIVGAGTLVGQMAAEDARLPYTAIARTNVTIAHFARSSVELGSDPPGRLAPFLLGLSSRQMSTTLQRIADRANLPPVARVAAEIAYLAQQSGPNPVESTQEELAEMIGLSRKTVNRSLKALEGMGLIEVSYARVTVRDLDRMQKIVGAQDC